MAEQEKVFKILKIVIVSLATILLLINLLYLKAGSSTPQCLIVNVATIILLVWVTLFWVFVLKHSETK